MSSFDVIQITKVFDDNARNNLVDTPLRELRTQWRKWSLTRHPDQSSENGTLYRDANSAVDDLFRFKRNNVFETYFPIAEISRYYKFLQNSGDDVNDLLKTMTNPTSAIYFFIARTRQSQPNITNKVITTLFKNLSINKNLMYLNFYFRLLDWQTLKAYVQQSNSTEFPDFMSQFQLFRPSSFSSYDKYLPTVHEISQIFLSDSVITQFIYDSQHVRQKSLWGVLYTIFSASPSMSQHKFEITKMQAQNQQQKEELKTTDIFNSDTRFTTFKTLLGVFGIVSATALFSTIFITKRTINMPIMFYAKDKVLLKRLVRKIMQRLNSEEKLQALFQSSSSTLYIPVPEKYKTHVLDVIVSEIEEYVKRVEKRPDHVGYAIYLHR